MNLLSFEFKVLANKEFLCLSYRPKGYTIANSRTPLYNGKRKIAKYKSHNIRTYSISHYNRHGSYNRKLTILTANHCFQSFLTDTITMQGRSNLDNVEIAYARQVIFNFCYGYNESKEIGMLAELLSEQI